MSALPARLSRLSGPALAALLFTMLALVVIALKGSEPQALLSRLQSGEPILEEQLYSFTCCLPTALRVGAAWTFGAVEAIGTFGARLVLVEPDAAPWYAGTPWPVDYHKADYVANVVVPFFSVYANKLLLLLPIYVVALALFRNLACRLFFIAVVFMALGGWPSIFINGLFSVMGSILDWPRAYYNFHERMLVWDFGALAYVHLLLLYLVFAREYRLWHVFLLAALGQVFFENLGFVTGIAFLLATFCMPRSGASLPWRLAVTRLVVAGVASGIVLLALSGLLIALDTTGHMAVRADGQSFSVFGYMADKWNRMGRYNFAWYNVTIANFISLMFFPVVFGALLGLLAALLDKEETPAVLRNQLRLSSCVTAAYLASLIIGLFNSGFGSDMGRQVAPLSCLVVLCMAKGVAATIASRRAHGAAAATGRPNG